MNLEQYDDSLKQSLPAGTVLLKQGTRSGKLYILLDGTVEVKREETLVATIDEPGAMFGEMSALLDVDHTANVIAATPVTVYQFTDAARFLQSDPQVVAHRRAQAGAAAEHRDDLSRGPQAAVCRAQQSPRHGQRGAGQPRLSAGGGIHAGI